jgi:hypothetical protein
MQDDGGDNGDGSHDAARAGWMEIPGHDDPDYDNKAPAVFERLGRPKDAKGYTFTDPKDFQFDDVDKEYRESFRGVAHRAHLTQRQVNMLQDWQIANAKLIRQAERDAAEGAPKASRAALEREYGRSFADRLKAANATVREMNLDALANTRLRDGSRLGDKAEFVKAMVALSENRQRAAGTVDSSAPVIGAAPSASDEALEQIKQGAIDQGLDPTHARWPHSILDKLYAKAYPGGALDTTKGSTANTQHRSRR